LIIDNVDHDHHDREDPQAYNVQTYFPHADHGSVLITSRLAGLQRLGSGIKVGTVAAEQARAILENNAGRLVKGKWKIKFAVRVMVADAGWTDAKVVLKLLHELPLALTQAGLYMCKTNASASTYARHYSQTWERLMKSEAHFPLEEYHDWSVLTMWTISYRQVQRQSKEAAWQVEVEAALPPPAVRLNTTLRQYAFRARKLPPSHPIPEAIQQLHATLSSGSVSDLEDSDSNCVLET
jgi:hypothetical protein